jgi:hypothetical protein
MRFYSYIGWIEFLMLLAPQMEPRWTTCWKVKEFGVWFLAGEKILLLAVSRLILNPLLSVFYPMGASCFFLGAYSGRGVKLTTYVCLVATLKMRVAISSLSIRLRSVVIN